MEQTYCAKTGKGSGGKRNRKPSSLHGQPLSSHSGPSYFSRSHSRHVSRCDWSTFVPGLDKLSLTRSSPNSASSLLLT